MRFTIIGLLLFLLVIPTWAGTLTDNFNDGNSDGWRLLKGDTGAGLLDETAQWTVKKGELVATFPGDRFSGLVEHLAYHPRGDWGRESRIH